MSSSKSMVLDGNIGPSTHAKRTFPSTVTRQQPHIPVPSNIMGLRLACGFISNLSIKRDVNFIIGIGPIIKPALIFSPSSCNFYIYFFYLTYQYFVYEMLLMVAPSYNFYIFYICIYNPQPPSPVLKF